MSTVKRHMCVEQYFNKKFEFGALNHHELQSHIYSHSKWQIEDLQIMKKQLNDTKSLLNQYDLIEWSQHTKNTDPSSLIKIFLKNRYKPELLTQAWCKFYECLSQFSLIPDECLKNNSFSSFHLCEAPGAFICSLNHYIHCQYNELQWVWYANTLNPYCEGNIVSEMIPDDKLIKHTLDHWYFGLDGTGDITKYYNHLHIVEKISQNQKVWLVTADGSVDCMGDPGEQESNVAFLHYCEVMTALSILLEGGSFVMKIFTMFEESTICLLNLLNTIFHKVTAYKPSTSKGGNSEVYLLCREYKGFKILEDIWDKLLLPLKLGYFEDTSMFGLDTLNIDFLSDVKTCCNFFMKEQIAVISQNIKYFKNSDEIFLKRMHDVKVSIAKTFMKRYKLSRIHDNKKVVPHLDISWFWNPSIENHYMKKYVSGYLVEVPEGIEVFHILCGKAIDSVSYSKFCDMNIYRMNFNYLAQKKKSMLYSQIVRLINDETIIFNIEDFELTPFHAFQKNMFYSIYNNLGKTTIVFIKIPFVTHFLTSLLFIMVHSYNSLFVHPSGALVLSDPKEFKNISKCFKEIDNIYKSLNMRLPFKCEILNVIHPSLLCDNEFFNLVFNYNNSIFDKNVDMIHAL